jgi:hypothetical protein
MANFFSEVWAIVRGETKEYSAKRLGIVTLLLLIGLFIAGYYSAHSIVVWTKNPGARGLPLTVSWELIGASMIVFLMMLGLQMNGRIGGALIDDRNRMSLSRFQLVSWTVLVVSSFLAIALVRAFTVGVSDALNIDVPTQLWQLLGITSISAVGRELVHASKKTKVVPNSEVVAARAAETLSVTTPEAAPTADEVDTNRAGALFRNASPADANVVNMFQGDEVGNVGVVDMSKVQMFFFTVAALVAYASEIYTMLHGAMNPKALTALPAIGPGLLTILTISHATYLGTKSLDHSSTSASPAALESAAKK